LQAEDGHDVVFSRAWLQKNEFLFSFSGMKSQVHQYLQKLTKNNQELTSQHVANIADAFQEAMVEVLSKKLIKAALAYDVQAIALV